MASKPCLIKACLCSCFAATSKHLDASLDLYSSMTQYDKTSPPLLLDRPRDEMRCGDTINRTRSFSTLAFQATLPLEFRGFSLFRKLCAVPGDACLPLLLPQHRWDWRCGPRAAGRLCATPEPRIGWPLSAMWLLFRFFLLRKDSFDELPFSFLAFCSVLGSYSTLQDLQECPSHVVALHQQHLRCPRPSSACSSGTSSGAMETVVASRPTSTTSTTLPHRLHATCAIQGIQNVCMSMARQAIATRY